MELTGRAFQVLPVLCSVSFSCLRSQTVSGNFESANFMRGDFYVTRAKAQPAH
jgi:hypothetical protein